MEIEIKKQTIKFQGEVSTSYVGISKLMQFYREASNYRDIEISIDFYAMTWFDANLAALLNALLYRLAKQNNLTFSTDYSYARTNFNVLFRNGLLRHKDFEIVDLQETTIPCAHFYPTQENHFIEYIAKRLMCNRGLHSISTSIKRRIQSDLFEIFQNIYRHARTEEPFFICGQYYPNKKKFCLTLVDLGVGFLKPIQEYTKGEISTHIGAIKWALSGKSSKVKDETKEIGGCGLEGILEYCKNSNGIFQIYSGFDFWDIHLDKLPNGVYQPFIYEFDGSLLNLIFNLK